MRKEIRSAIFLILAVSIFGFTSTVARGIYSVYPGLKSITLVQIRMFLGGLIFLVFLLISKPRSLVIPLRAIGSFAVIGICGVFVVQFFLMYAVKQISAGLASFVQASSTLMLCAYSSVVMKEKLRWNKVFGLVFGIAGIGILFFEPGMLAGNRRLILGIVAALISAIGKTTYILLAKRYLANYDPYVMITFALLSGGVFSLLLDPPIEFIMVYLPQARIAWFTIIMATVGTVLPFALFFNALKHLEPSTTGILNVAEPLAATFAGFLILGEVLRLQQYLGGFLIITGITVMYLAEMWRNKSKQEVRGS